MIHIRSTAAEDFLSLALAHGPRDAAEVRSEALRAGISRSTVYRAANRIGVRTTVSGRAHTRRSIWSL